ncbi:nucleolar protein 8-like [Ylistrum balloti]|uniref:nucleolar protein 8-like n=1 Tax=Ylistrum balloti TaxID=509963 RepID=UPI0029059AEC|nr:nucleolar protein 8-like [Ylistrum balloti]
MESTVKRLFVGGLFNNITDSELRDRFSKFGNVDSIEIKTKKNSNGLPEKTFAYLDVNITDENLKKCLSVLNKSRWKGNELKIQHAKADFMKRLKEERENNFEKPAKVKNKKVILQDPLEGVAGVENFHMKGAVPGTQVDVEEKNWVVGKYGRVLPIVNIRKRDKKKFMKVDPSKFCHNSKRMKDDMEMSDTGIQNLTWTIDTNDSEMVKRRKGEFPAWKQKKRKQNFDVDMKSLADYYESFTNTESKSGKTDFEVVPESFQKASGKRAYFSEDSDSCDNGDESFKTSTPFQSTVTQSQQIAALSTGKDSSVKGKNSNTGKLKSEDPKCTPIVKTLGKDKVETHFKKLGNVDHSESSSPIKKTKTQETLQTSVLPNAPTTSLSQNTVSTGLVSDKHSSSTSKQSKTQAEERIHNQSNSTSKECLNDSVNKASSKTTEHTDVFQGKKTTKKPKLQAFGGTRHLYDNLSSDGQQKMDSASLSKVTSSSSLSNPDQLHSEAISGVKRTLFQNSMLKDVPEKEMELQQDSDNESVSSADTDVIIASAKKQRRGGTVIGYGSLETPVSLQNSLTSSIHSEFGGGLVDGEASRQGSWMEEHGYNSDDSVDSNDFEKIAKKILKNYQGTNNFAQDKEKKDSETEIQALQRSDHESSEESDSNDDSETERKALQSSDHESSKESDSNDDSGDDKSNDTTSDEEEASDSSAEDINSNNKDNKGNSDKECDEDESNDEESDEDKSNDEESDEDESTSSDDDEDTKVVNGVVESTDINKHARTEKHDVSNKAKENTGKQQQQEINNKSAEDTMEKDRKSKDKVEQKRLSVEANKKKQELLRQKQEEYNTRKSIIKQALSTVDNSKRSNRIVFDSDSDDDTTEKSNTTQQSDKKAWDLQDSDDEEESEDESSEEESAEESDEIIQSGVVDKTDNKEKKSLFEDSSSEDDDIDENAFENKPQFEGEAGSELMKLQMKFSSDSRFKLDQRFVESDEEQGDGEGNVEEVEDEKMRNLKVLQDVVGVQVAVVTDKNDRMKKLFKDISTLQYDPSREDHKSFEIQPSADQKKSKDGKKNKSKKQKVEEEEEEAEPLPEVSSEKFYEVSSALEDAFKKAGETESKLESGGFSLLAAFGSKQEDNDQVDDMQAESTSPTQKWQGFNFQNSDDDDMSDDSNEEKELEGEEDSKKEEKAVFVAKSQDSFFFTEDDERIKEGVSSFCRQEDLEKIRERWQEKRPDLMKAYHNKYKRAIRNKRALEKKRTFTKR